MKYFKIFALLSIFIFTFYLLSSHYKPTLDSLADMVIKRCGTTKIKTLCYEAEIPKLMRAITMENAFKVTQIVQDKDPHFISCHNLAHDLSEIQSRNIGWQETVHHCPQAICNYGCLHGAFAGRFRGDVLSETQIENVLPEILSVCEPRDGYKPSDLDMAMCYHGIGHLAMYITGGSPKRTISICEKIKTASPGISYTRLCVEGMFMTVFHGQENPEDVALVKDIKPERRDILTFCSQYPGYWDICRRESYGLFLHEPHTPQSLVNFCSYAIDRNMKEYCYLGVISIFTTEAFSSDNGLNLLESYCRALPDQDKYLCFSGASMRLLQSDPLRYVKTAAAICNLASKYGVERKCYEDATYYAEFTFGSSHPEKRAEYCSEFPETWKDKCLYQKR